MTLILGEPLIIDQDHSSSELISFHTLEPCKLMSNNRLRTGQLNEYWKPSRTLTNHGINSLNPMSGVRLYEVAVKKVRYN